MSVFIAYMCVRVYVRVCVRVWNSVYARALAQLALTVCLCFRACEGFNCGFPFYSVYAFFFFFFFFAHWSNVLIVVIRF